MLFWFLYALSAVSGIATVPQKNAYVVETVFSTSTCTGDVVRVEATPSGQCKQAVNGKSSSVIHCMEDGTMMMERCSDSSCKSCFKIKGPDPNTCLNGDTSTKHTCSTNVEGQKYFKDNGFVTSFYYTSKSCEETKLRSLVMKPIMNCLPYADSTFEQYSCSDKEFFKQSFSGQTCRDQPFEAIRHSLDLCKNNFDTETVRDVCTTTAKHPPVTTAPKVPQSQAEGVLGDDERVDSASMGAVVPKGAPMLVSERISSGLTSNQHNRNKH